MQKWMTTSLCAALLVGCGKEKASNGHDLVQKGESIAVTAMTLKTQKFENWQEFTADLKGAQDIQLVTRIGGKLEKLAKVGQRFGAGQSLCGIETSRYQAMVNQAQAALVLAQSEDNRMRANVQAGSIGKDALLKTKLDIENARVALMNAQTNLRDNQCPAPFAGVVVSRTAEDFQFVAPGSSLMRLADDRNLQAVIAVPEMQARFLRAGQNAQFSLVTDPSVQITARISDMDLAADARTRTYKARLTIPNQGGLKIGMVGRVKILTSSYDNAIVVPSSALLRMQNGIFAMVVGKDSKAESRALEIGETAGSQVHVLKGLNAGDRLISSGAFRVTAGTALQVQEQKQ